MSGATHLHNRLDIQDIAQIHSLNTCGTKANEIARRYRVSGASVYRILHPEGWNPMMKSKWVGWDEITPLAHMTDPSQAGNNGAIEFPVMPKPAPFDVQDKRDLILARSLTDSEPAEHLDLVALLDERKMLKRKLVVNAEAIMRDLGL